MIHYKPDCSLSFVLFEESKRISATVAASVMITFKDQGIKEIPQDLSSGSRVPPKAV